MSADTNEVFLRFPAQRQRVEPVTAIRSTLIMSSLKTLRDEGLYELYESKLSAEDRELVRNIVTPCWLPIEVALMHYGACNELNLSANRVGDIARSVAMSAQGTFLGVAMGLARGVGVTPWTVLGQTHRIWQRAFQGGGISVFKAGDTDARIEIVGWPCARIEYCRHAFRGIIHGVTLLLSKSTHVKDLGSVQQNLDSIAYRISWT